MTISAKVIADSISPKGDRITTLQLLYPRFIHAEFMTHRVFSRNASSSRAIPVAKIIGAIQNDPAMPVSWGQNQKGMQADQDVDAATRKKAEAVWLLGAQAAIKTAEAMIELGIHKQIANRVLELGADRLPALAEFSFAGPPEHKVGEGGCAESGESDQLLLLIERSGALLRLDRGRKADRCNVVERAILPAFRQRAVANEMEILAARPRRR